MGKMISIHQYQLKSGVSDATFHAAIRHATDNGLFDLPGLEQFYFLRGIKGERAGKWSAIWIFTSRKAWEDLWGSPGKPKSKQEYPEQWKRWEDDMLAPLITEDPDAINYTTYEDMFSSFTGRESP